MNKKEKLNEWAGLNDDERRKYNGFNGFVSGLHYSDGSLFTKHITAKAKRKADKSSKWKK